MDSSANATASTDVFRLYELLDRYEELIEDMRELGVDTLEQAESKITELNVRIDEIEAAGGKTGS